MPNSNLPDRGCDPIGDILTLSSGSKRMPVTKKDQLLQSGLMTFPQIWVESVCDESSDDDYDDEDDQSRLRRRTHDPSKSIRCLSSSSTDVSFESASTASLSPASTRQNSLQLMSRENSVEVTGLNAEPEPEPTCDKFFTEEVGSWLERINARGFPVDLLRRVAARDDDDDDEDEDDAEDDDTWWEPGLVRVFDPYFDIAVKNIESIEGKVGADGRPVGQCNVVLKNGDSAIGLFRKGQRQGRGAIEGANCYQHGIVGIKGFYKDGVLSGEGRAILAPGAWGVIER